MSEQWHYEQKGGSYIKVDTLHKISTLESELAAARKRIAKLKEQYTPWWARKRSEIDKLREVTEQRDRLAEAMRKVVTSWDEATWLDDNEFESFRDALAAVKGGSDE